MRTWARSWPTSTRSELVWVASVLIVVFCSFTRESTSVSTEVLAGLVLAMVGIVVMSFSAARVGWVLALAALVWQLSLLNNASADAYFAMTLQTWEQGRFIRFHGLIQWLGWLWPYALLMYLVSRLSSTGLTADA